METSIFVWEIRVFARLIILAGFFLHSVVDANASSRVALVIGISNYQSVARLENPHNDAVDIAAALEITGFDVELALDLNVNAFREALSVFSRRAARSDVAVIYFAGHGIEIDGQNFLLPSDASLVDARDVNFDAMPLDLVRRAAEPARELSLVIVDACRNNPFVETLQTASRSLSRGLKLIVPKGTNNVVAFAAKAGTIAEDGEGRNSPYAAALKQALIEPGLEIGKLFRRVTHDVISSTDGRQEPAYYGRLPRDDFFFLPPEETEAPSQDSMAEFGYWIAIADSNDPNDYRRFIQNFPQGQYAGLALERMEKLLSSPTVVSPVDDPVGTRFTCLGSAQDADTLSHGSGQRTCVQRYPVTYEEIQEFVDDQMITIDGMGKAIRDLERAPDGTARNVSFWLARRYADWFSDRTGRQVCVADVETLNNISRIQGTSFEKPKVPELTSRICADYAVYVSTDVFVSGNDGTSALSCQHEFAHLPDQVFRLMESPACR